MSFFEKNDNIMETETIVLVLVSLCGGAALVMLASAYRSIQTKVNVNDYELEKLQTEVNIRDEFRGINEELESLRNDFNNQIDDISREADKINKRIDSRSDKLHEIFENRINDIGKKINKN